MASRGKLLQSQKVTQKMKDEEASRKAYKQVDKVYIFKKSSAPVCGMPLFRGPTQESKESEQSKPPESPAHSEPSPILPILHSEPILPILHSEVIPLVDPIVDSVLNPILDSGLNPILDPVLDPLTSWATDPATVIGQLPHRFHASTISFIIAFLQKRNSDCKKQRGLGDYYVLMITGEPGCGKTWSVKKAIQEAKFDLVRLELHNDFSYLSSPPNVLDNDKHLDKNCKAIFVDDLEGFLPEQISGFASAIQACFPKVKKTKVSVALNPIIVTCQSSYHPKLSNFIRALGIRRQKGFARAPKIMEIACEPCTNFQRAKLVDSNDMNLTRAIHHRGLTSGPVISKLDLLSGWKALTCDPYDAFDAWSHIWDRAVIEEHSNVLDGVFFNTYPELMQNRDAEKTKQWIAQTSELYSDVDLLRFAGGAREMDEGSEGSEDFESSLGFQQWILRFGLRKILQNSTRSYVAFNRSIPRSTPGRASALLQFMTLNELEDLRLIHTIRRCEEERKAEQDMHMDLNEDYTLASHIGIRGEDPYFSAVDIEVVSNIVTHEFKLTQ